MAYFGHIFFDKRQEIVSYTCDEMNTMFTKIAKQHATMGQVSIWQRCSLPYGDAGLKC
jgi:hypothetical protein